MQLSEPIYVAKQKMSYNSNSINNNHISMPLSAVGIDECDRGTEALPPSPLYVAKQPIYVSSMKSSIKAPPYKNPPAYHGQDMPSSPVSVSSPQHQQKSVKFADSPVLLRRKVCFEDEVVNGQQQQQQNLGSPRHRQSKDTPAPLPPPRAEGTRLSTQLTAPRRLADSTSNPPQDFLQDLQRVMRKKWQISQKCKLEPATTPHEVLGFRDFDANGVKIENFHLDAINSTPFYRESSNVSNWVQEHYGGATGAGGAAMITVDSLYANLGTGATERCPIPSMPIMKKRPPPPPPKRNTTTVLTHRT